MHTSATFDFFEGDTTVSLGVRWGKVGYIAQAGLLPGVDPESYYEVYGMRRQVGPRLSPKKSLRLAWMVENIGFTISQGLPLLWVCSRQHAEAYRAIYEARGLTVEVLRGSLRPDNPYPPLVLDNPETGGSDDEHIIRVSRP